MAKDDLVDGFSFPVSFSSKRGRLEMIKVEGQLKYTYGLVVIALFTLGSGFEPSAAWAEKNQVELGKKYIRVGGTNYHRNHHEAAFLGALGVKRDVASPWFEERVSWGQLEGEDLDVVDDLMLFLDADMSREWNAEIEMSKSGNDGSIGGSGGGSVSGTYTLQKYEIENKINIPEMINNSEFGQIYLSSLYSNHHQGIHIVTAVWKLVEGSEIQESHGSISGSASKDGKGTTGEISGGASKHASVEFEFNAGTVMAYQMDRIKTENCSRRAVRRYNKNPRHSGPCRAIDIETDTYRR